MSDTARSVAAEPVHDVVLWRLDPAGTCGVGDHSRGLVRELGGRIVDVAAGDVPSGSIPMVVQYVPTGWVQVFPWTGDLAGYLETVPHEARRTLLAHELERYPPFEPRSLAHWVADRTGLLRVVSEVDRVIVTTEHRKETLRGIVGPSCPDVRVVGVPSNVHAPWALRDRRGPPAGAPTLALFMTASEPDATQARAVHVIEESLRRIGGLEVIVMGRRRRDDALSQAFSGPEGRRVTLTGALDAEEIVSRLAHATVALAISNTGTGGRRGTFAAYLAAGLPTIATRGVDTDAVHLRCAGVTFASFAERFDVDAMASAVQEVVSLTPDAWQLRSRAVRELYANHHSFRALAAALTP